MVKEKMCYTCKQKFPRKELIDYASIGTKTMHSYCLKCYKERLEREKFSEKVCSIFGIKTPGPRIWSERKRIQEKYGYTDDTIIECLNYIYNIEKIKKISETLFFVNPINVEKAIKYKEKEQYNNYKIITSINVPMQEHIVTAQENIKSNKQNWNPDDWIEND